METRIQAALGVLVARVETPLEEDGTAMIVGRNEKLVLGDSIAAETVESAVLAGAPRALENGVRGWAALNGVDTVAPTANSVPAAMQEAWGVPQLLVAEAHLAVMLGRRPG